MNMKNMYRCTVKGYYSNISSFYVKCFAYVPAIQEIVGNVDYVLLHKVSL